MYISIEELKITEEILTQYFKNIKVLKIWKASIHSKREHKNRLEVRIQSGPLIHFADNVKSTMLSHASPSNRQPPKGLDACIDKAEEIYDNLLIELHTTELDIIVTEEGIEKLEQNTVFISEVIKTLSNESRRILELKLGDNKSFDDIGDVIKKSKSATHEFYKKIIRDICKWLKYVNALEPPKK